jgi:hypothetical protein
MSLQQMELSGDLTREALTTGEVPRHREAIRDRLRDANNEENSSRTRLEQAYYAILTCARIALRVDGYRVSSVRGHHRITLETLRETMGVDAESIDYYSQLSRIRNSDLYDAMPVGESDASEAVEEAAKLVERLDTWLEGRGIEA